MISQTAWEKHCAALGVSPLAKPWEIKRAFRRLAKLLHPDLHENSELAKRKFQELLASYSYLNFNYTQRPLPLPKKHQYRPPPLSAPQSDEKQPTTGSNFSGICFLIILSTTLFRYTFISSKPTPSPKNRLSIPNTQMIESTLSLPEPLLRQVAKAEEAHVLSCEARGERHVFGHASPCPYFYPTGKESLNVLEVNNSPFECVAKGKRTGVPASYVTLCENIGGIAKFYRLE